MIYQSYVIVGFKKKSCDDRFVKGRFSKFMLVLHGRHIMSRAGAGATLKIREKSNITEHTARETR